MNPSARVLTLSTIAFTLLFAVWLMFGVLGVPIKEELHLDTVQFSWLGAIAILSGSIWRLPLGILTDRVGGGPLATLVVLWHTPGQRRGSFWRPPCRRCWSRARRHSASCWCARSSSASRATRFRSASPGTPHGPR